LLNKENTVPDEITRAKIASDILDVYNTRKRLPPLNVTYPELEEEDSYRIQQAVIQGRVSEEGVSVRGYKIGLTSKPMQEQMGSSEPDFSAITDDWFFPEGMPLRQDRFFAPLTLFFRRLKLSNFALSWQQA
jgi:2-oxo-hept-3-ene-1,7-dioate hydratase/2-keto-4-pentenoate hydratase